jgi:RNA polymerase sigma factor (sigma-70 family)
MEPARLPHPDRLRSTVESVSETEWARAYPFLHEAGRRVAAVRLAGARWESDREDLVAAALHQFVRGLIENSPKSFKQIRSWDDCLGMMRRIVRSRVTDFHRSAGRNLEDSVETLPEPEVIAFPGTEEIDAEALQLEVDRLDPPMPELFRDRFIEGLTLAEIAERRGINRNTLCTWFADALAKLRQRLGSKERP